MSESIHHSPILGTKACGCRYPLGDRVREGSNPFGPIGSTMPIKQRRCSSCGEKENVCPICGSRKVTPMDEPGKPKPNDIVMYGDDGQYTYRNVCWDCGWHEDVTVTIVRE